MDVTKRCTKCEKVKPIESGFYVHRRNDPDRKDSVSSKCRSCILTSKRKPRKCLGCGGTYFRIGSAGSRRRCCDDCAKTGRVCSLCDKHKPFDRFYAGENSKYCKDGCALAINRRTLYGIEPTKYAEMHLRLAGKCESCGRSDRPLDVDHCHTTGEIRGLLCGHCNRGLGQFGDSVPAMLGAIAYIERVNDQNPRP